MNGVIAMAMCGILLSAIGFHIDPRRRMKVFFIVLCIINICLALACLI